MAPSCHITQRALGQTWGSPSWLPLPCLLLPQGEKQVVWVHT